VYLSDETKDKGNAKITQNHKLQMTQWAINYLPCVLMSSLLRSFYKIRLHQYITNIFNVKYQNLEIYSAIIIQQ